ncbi:unnamed protein product [Paramecium sonneborni]|uniref:Protein kinase domain-containing protein n=1 Tax=Paramecium sonneborni TaxID=65129 RepID=A0A8S1NJR3_9CILI|nr:unnamed protein product [Paramecium sonneborni]
MQAKVKFPFSQIQFLTYGVEGQVYKIKKEHSGEVLTAIYLNEKLEESEKQQLEIIYSSKFNHIIKIIDFSQKLNQDILIMECGEQSLKKLIETDIFQQQSHEYKNKLFLQTLLGVEEFYSLNDIHSNLKPYNFLCCSGNQSIQIKLIDFGLKESEYRKHLYVRGTDYYMAPEVKHRNHYDQSADLWSLGVIWYEMLSGDLEIFKIFQLTQLELDDNINLNDKIDVKEKTIISKILLFQPEKRMKLNQLISEIRNLCLIKNKQQEEKIEIIKESVQCQIESQINTSNIDRNRNQMYETIFQEGQNLVNEGQYEQALNKLNTLISLNKENADLYVWKGIALQNLNKYLEAIDCYDKSISINPRNDSAWNNKGFALQNLNKYLEAIHCYDNSISINPRNNSAWFNKGSSLFQLKVFSDAIVCFDKALSIFKNPLYFEKKADSLLELKNKKEAKIMYSFALELGSKNQIYIQNQLSKL